jgi:hypothetical protein
VGTLAESPTFGSRIRLLEASCVDSRLAACREGRTRDTIVSVLIAGILGWMIGVAQLIFIDSWSLIYWEFVPLIPYAARSDGRCWE